MQSNSQSAPVPEAGARWPACSMLGFGTFGSRTPAGKRYHARCKAALISMVVAVFGGAAWAMIRGRSPVFNVILALLPGVTFGFIAWEFRVYLASLDELARRIQLEAMAWTYLTGMAIASLAGGIALIFGWAWSPLWLNPLWFLFLEPVRGTWLYFVARRY